MAYKPCKECIGWRYCRVITQADIGVFVDQYHEVCGKIKEDPSSINLEGLRRLFETLRRR